LADDPDPSSTSVVAPVRPAMSSTWAASSAASVRVGKYSGSAVISSNSALPRAS